MILSNMKKIRLFIIIIVIILFTCSLYNRYISINRFCKNTSITKVILVLSDIKAGLNYSETTTIETIDQQEIQEIVNTLNKSMIFKTIPSIGNVKTNSNDRFELKISLITENKDVLEYLITSEGNIKIVKNNDKSFSSVIIINGSASKLFDNLKSLFIQKEQNIKWQ